MALVHVTRKNNETLNKSKRCSSLVLLTIVSCNIAFTTATQDFPHHPCDAFKCVLPVSEIICPEDSDIRETLSPNSPMTSYVKTPPQTDDVLNTTTTTTTAAAAAAAAAAFGSFTDFSANSAIDNEILNAKCCISKKCVCRTCYIPDCDKYNEVVVELIPESPDIPGHCCGEYTCQVEPNCTEVRDTDQYWLTDCQRCSCYLGERICHQHCDFGMKKSTAICTSKNLNTFFQHGDSWKDGCYECECVNGEEKCVMPFCRSVNCPPERQVFRERDSCCPICWPMGIPMPNDVDDDNNVDGDNDNDNDNGKNSRVDDSINFDYDDNVPLVDSFIDDSSSDSMPNVKLGKEINESSTATTTTTTTTTVSKAANVTATTTDSDSDSDPDTVTATDTATATNISNKINSTSTVTATTPTTTVIATTTAVPSIIETTAAAPTISTSCVKDNNHRDHDSSNLPPAATYQVYPGELVNDDMHPSKDNYILLYIIIAALMTLIGGLLVYIYRLRGKQRSYRPVSSFDNNFNKTSTIVQKPNDFA